MPLVTTSRTPLVAELEVLDDVLHVRREAVEVGLEVAFMSSTASWWARGRRRGDERVIGRTDIAVLART